MFYDRFIELCKQKGVSPTRAALEAGISKSLVSKWKSNAAKEPSPEVLRKIADYFGISPYEVLEAKEEKSLDSEDQELNEYLEMLRTRPEMKMMFQLAKGATKEDVEKAVRVIEAMLGKDSKGD
ncbi:MAG: helix-turn-helix domain-containing protein [Agathobaculum sp.]